MEIRVECTEDRKALRFRLPEEVWCSYGHLGGREFTCLYPRKNLPSEIDSLVSWMISFLPDIDDVVALHGDGVEVRTLEPSFWEKRFFNISGLLCSLVYEKFPHSGEAWLVVADTCHPDTRPFVEELISSWG